MMQCKWACVVMCACGLWWALPATAQEKKPAEATKKTETPQKAEEGKQPGAGQAEADKMAEMMKKCMEYGTPGEHHKYLEPLVGKWTYEVRWWLSPASEPQTSRGTATYKWILDGRYLQQDATCPPEGPDAPPFAGIGLLGYDNMKKQYVSIWIDNMSTSVMFGMGTCDAAGRVVTVAGEIADPMTGQMNEKWRTVTRIESNDKHVFEMYTTQPDGKEIKQMEITYTRAK